MSLPLARALFLLGQNAAATANRRLDAVWIGEPRTILDIYGDAFLISKRSTIVALLYAPWLFPARWS
jgi:hypothetical protein